MKETTKKNNVTRRIVSLFLLAVVSVFASKNDVKATEQATVNITVAEQKTTQEQVAEEVEQKIIMFGNGTTKGTLPDGTSITVTVTNGALEAKFGTESYEFRNALEIVASALVSDDGFIHIYTFDHKYYMVDPVSGVDIPVWRDQETWQYVAEHAANSKEVYVSAFIDNKYFYETVSGSSKSRERLVTKEDFERIITPNKPEQPVTEAPKTETPTTEAPATEVPTTEVPTTAAPVSEAPTTEVPTTEEPVTEVPKTEAPTTEVPATETPSTEVPTTAAPVTEAPKTEAPTTVAPATEEPKTEAPTTVAPVTEAPKTEAPTTVAPVTEAPKTEVSTTTAPVTEAPKEVRVVDSVVKVEVVQATTTEIATTEKATTEQATTEKVVSKAKKTKTTYKVEMTGKKINKIKLVRYKGSKRKVLCTVTFNREKHLMKFHKVKYKGVKEVTYSDESHQIVMLKDNQKAVVIPRAKWKSGKTYTEKILSGKWRHIIRQNGFAIAVSNGSKIKGVKNAQPKLVKNKK